MGKLYLLLLLLAHLSDFITLTSCVHWSQNIFGGWLFSAPLLLRPGVTVPLLLLLPGAQQQTRRSAICYFRDVYPFIYFIIAVYYIILAYIVFHFVDF